MKRRGASIRPGRSKKPRWFKPGLINTAQTICKPTRSEMVRAPHRPDRLVEMLPQKGCPGSRRGTRGKDSVAWAGDLPPTLRLALGPSKRGEHSAGPELSRWQLTGTEPEGLNTAPRSTALRALHNGPDDTRSRVVSLCRGRRDSGSRRCGLLVFRYVAGRRTCRSDKFLLVQPPKRLKTRRSASRWVSAADDAQPLVSRYPHGSCSDESSAVCPQRRINALYKTVFIDGLG